MTTTPGSFLPPALLALALAAPLALAQGPPPAPARVAADTATA